MKKPILFFIALLFSVNANAATYYADSVAGSDSTGVGTIGNPYRTWPGSPLDGVNGLACGESFLFKRNSVYEGITDAGLIRNHGTTACSGSPITFGAYGAGNDPIFYADAEYAGSWTNTTGNIWRTDFGSTTNPKGYTLANGTESLMIWSVANNTVPDGSYCPSSSLTAGTACNTVGPYIYINIGEDPAGDSLRIGNNTVSSRGLFRGPVSGSAGTYGHYLDWKDLDGRGSPLSGLIPTGSNNRAINIHFNASRNDTLIAIEYAPGNEDSEGFTDYYGVYEGGAAGGSGFGQGMTVYSGGVTLVGTVSTLNGMAGLDILDYDTTDVEAENFTGYGLVLTKNGRSAKSNSFDPIFYVDGGHNVLLHSSKLYNQGIQGASGQLNSRQCIKLGSEHPVDEIVSGIHIVNVLGTGCHSFCMKTDNLNQGDPDNISDLNFYWVSLLSNAGTSGDRNLHFANLTATADTAKIRNSILVGNSGALIDDSAYTGTSLDMDYNLYYRRGQASTANLYGGVTACGGGADTNCTLTEWQTQTGEDATSAYGNPLFVSDSSTAPDLHLQASSPAFGTGQVDAWDVNSLSWVPSAIKTDIGSHGVRGITASTGVEDTDWNDLGFHYNTRKLTSANVEPASLIAGATGNVSITFVIPEKVSALLSMWKIVVVFPDGFTFDQGGSTAFTSSDIDGTFSTAVSGTTVTVTRQQDGSSLFPGTYTGTFSNVKNPSAGSPGVYKVYLVENRSFTNFSWNSHANCNGIYDSTIGCIQAQDDAVATDIFTSPSSGATVINTSTSFSCTATCIAT